MSKTINPYESLYDVLVFDSRDWSQNKNDAWIYGVVVGWTKDNEDDAEEIFKEFNKKFGWSRETWKRLHLLNKIYLTNIDKA